MENWILQVPIGWRFKIVPWLWRNSQAKLLKLLDFSCKVRAIVSRLERNLLLGWFEEIKFNHSKKNDPIVVFELRYTVLLYYNTEYHILQNSNYWNLIYSSDLSSQSIYLLTYMTKSTNEWNTIKIIFFLRHDNILLPFHHNQLYSTNFYSFIGLIFWFVVFLLFHNSYLVRIWFLVLTTPWGGG